MDAIATTIVITVALYVAAGLVAGIAFVTVGVTTVQNAPVTVGARILLLPAATALWPLVVSRWLKTRRRPQ
jgi:hypothetical protein